MNKFNRVQGFLIFLTASFLLSFTIGARADSYVPQVYLGGYGGSGLLGQTDILAPVYLSNNSNLFIYGQGRYSYEKQSWANNSWMGSAGLGYRHIVNNSAILGAYVLGDYSQTVSGHNIAEISPGIEALGRVWEFRANGYVPVGKTDWNLIGWADNFGCYDYVQFRGHDEYDAKFLYHLETGPGGDTEIGRNLFTIKHVVVKGYLDGYFYNMQHEDDIYGGGARVTVEPSNYFQFSVNDTYDNYYKNVIMAGVRINLNNLISNRDHVDTNDLQNKLFTPIQRNFANIASGSNIRDAGGPQPHGFDSNGLNKEPYKVYPNPKGYIDDVNPPSNIVWPYINILPFPSRFLERGNIWFFNGSATSTATNGFSFLADGTYLHPYGAGDFKQAMLKSINDWTHQYRPGSANTSLYFAPGSYLADNNGNPVELYNGQSIYGRTADFKNPATTKPIFNGSLQLDGDNTLDSIKLENNANHTFNSAINIVNGAEPIQISNVYIGSSISILGGNYATGITMGNSSVDITNSDIYAHAVDANAVGIKMANAGHLTVDHSNIYSNAKTDVSANSNSGNAYGIDAYGNGNNITVENGSTISANGNANNIDANKVSVGNGYGILVGSLHVLNTTAGISGNTITIKGSSSVEGTGNSTSSNYSGNGYGLLVGIGYDDNITKSTKITNNHITLDHATMTGQGDVSGLGSTFAGNGFGVALGGNYVGVGDRGSVSVSSNIISITNSILTANGKASADSSSASGNGFGFLVGFNGVNIVNNAGTVQIGSEVSHSFNDIQVKGSTFNATGNSGASLRSDGNAFGFLLGYNWVNKVNATNTDKAFISTNKIYMDKTTSDGKKNNINANVAGQNGAAYGINYGLYGTPKGSSPESIVDVGNTNFDINNANHGDIYGIWAGRNTLMRLTAPLTSNSFKHSKTVAYASDSKAIHGSAAGQDKSWQ